MLAEVTGGCAEGESTPLDLQIEPGLTVVQGSDEVQLVRTLQMAAGVIPAHHGVVRLLGMTPAVEELGGRELRRRVGYVTPRAPLLSVLDGVRNVMLPALYHRLPGEEAVMQMVQGLLDEMGGDYDHRSLPAFMPELQQRMLLLARALILEPRLLFVEQPLQGLDNRSRDRLREYLVEAVLPRVEALVVASNDPLLASSAQQVVLLGRERHRIYESWSALLASDEAEAREFIEHEQQFCSVLHG